MAIPHFRATIIGAGKSAVAAAAYRHRTKMFDASIGSHTHRYDRENDLVFSEIDLPENAPEWIKSYLNEFAENKQKSEWLWNYIQDNERANGQLSREIVLALPNELSREKNIELVREFIKENISNKGIVSDWVYHEKEGNPHIHLMHTLRPLAINGFGNKKIPVLNADGTVKKINNKIVYDTVIGGKNSLKNLRNAWGEVASKHLAIAGYDITLDMRSFEERGIKLEPGIHLGKSATAMKAKGVESSADAANQISKKSSLEKIKSDPNEILKLLSFERSTFTRKDIAKTLNRYVDDHQEFQSLMTSIEQSDLLVKVQHNQNSNKIIYSTKNIIETEFKMAKNVEFLVDTKGYGLKDNIIEKAILSVENKDKSRPFKFAEEQVLAVKHVTEDNGASAIVGYAGAGKSTLLEAANVAWKNSGYRVFGAALAGKAAEGLEESSGIKSRTLASWELSWQNGKDILQQGDVFIIDEAGMVSSKQLSNVIQKVKEAGAKVVLVGDPMQLQPIEAGAAFRAVMDKVGYLELSGVRRQKEKWAQEASKLFAQGKVKEAIDSYNDRGFIHNTITRDEAISSIVYDWMNVKRDIEKKAAEENKKIKGDELLILAHTNAAVGELNVNIRQSLKNENFLKEKNALNFVTMKGTREFLENDRIIFLENSKFKEMLAPELGMQEVKNGMLGTVLSTQDKSGRELLRVKLDSGREVVFSHDTYSNIDHGYAATIHKSQGVTVDNVFVLASPSMDQHLSYVAMSRHRHESHLYVAKEDFENVRVRENYSLKSPLTGTLIATGFVKYDKMAITETPYADIQTVSGIERIYGVNLPKALDDENVQLGDKIEIIQNKEDIKIAIDGEQRQVKRNLFTISLKERFDPSINFQQNKNDDTTYQKLIASLSRTGSKTTTLDYDKSADYRDYIANFSQIRGIDIHSNIGERISKSFETKRDWIKKQATNVSSLWNRATKAFSKIEKEKVLQNHHYYIEPVTEHKTTVKEEALVSLRNQRSYVETFDVINQKLKSIYKDPQTAAIKIEKTILSEQGNKLADIIFKSPEKAGELKGSNKIIDKFSTAGKERKEAINSVPYLATELRMLQSIFKNSFEIHLSKIENDRKKLGTGVPCLSEDAKSYISNITKNVSNTFKVPDHIAQELAQFKTSLDKRFGKDAIFENDFKFDKLKIDNKQHVKELQQGVKFLQVQKKQKIQEIVQSRSIQKGRSI